MDKKKILIIGGIVLGVIVLVVVGILLFKKPKEEEKPQEEEKKTLEVVSYELQTHEYFENKPEENKYMINTVEELNKFYYLYSDVLNIKEKELKDYTMFVEVREESSGSVENKLKSVSIGKKVTFVIDTKSPEVGTDDMAFWYFVAMIPNERLVDVDLSDWSIPSVIMEKRIALKDYEFVIDSEEKFVITTDSRYSTLQDDGGSYDNIYYNIDLTNKVVTKYLERYSANLTGTPSTTTAVLYAKRIDEKIVKDLKTSLINIANSVDSGTNDSKFHYNLKTLNFSKDYYDKANVDNLKKIIEKFEQ